MVITKDMSRLGRDYLSAGYYIEHYFPTNDVGYIAINDQVDTLLNDNEFAPFRNIMNERYARDISKKIRSAYHTKAMNGEFTGPFPPYGYDKKPENKNQHAVNSAQAGIVKRIFSLYLSGVNVYGISQALKADRVMIPRAELFGRLEKYHSEATDRFPFDWSTKTILNILENSEYTGNIVCNRHQTSSFKSKKLLENPKDRWIVTSHRHEAIIDEETFRRVREKIGLVPRVLKTSHENLFRGLVRCGDCGKTLTLSIRPSRRNYATLDCSTYRRYGKSRCGSHYVTYEQLEIVILQKINRLISLAKSGIEAFRDAYPHQTDFSDRLDEMSRQICDQENRIQEIDKITKALYENFVLGRIQEEKFLVLDKSYDEEKITLIKNIKTFQREYDELKKKQEGVATFCERLSGFEILAKLDQGILRDLVEQVIVFRDKGADNSRRIEIHFKFLGKV